MRSTSDHTAITRQAHIDVVLPCYNPVSGWHLTVIERVRQLQAALPQYRFTTTIINDGSVYGIEPEHISMLEHAIQDFTWLTYATNAGKGHALRIGIADCKGEVILYTDIDFPYTNTSILSCIKAVEDGSDLALAVRNASYYSKLPAGRRWVSKTLKRINRSLLGLQASDTQGGLKAMNQRAKAVFVSTRIKRYLFDLEFVYLLSKTRGTVITEVESELREGVTFSRLKPRILIAEGMNFIRLLFKL